MDRREDDHLDAARQRAVLSWSELWLRYFALGGMSSAMEMEAICSGLLVPTVTERNRIALALNERFLELGADDYLDYHDETP